VILSRKPNGTIEAPPVDRIFVCEKFTMHSIKYIYWQEGDEWLGYLQDFPDYWTQGDSLDDLVEHLRDLYADLNGGKIRGVRRVGEFAAP
jgi:hypothetical protein